MNRMLRYGVWLVLAGGLALTGCSRQRDNETEPPADDQNAAAPHDAEAGVEDATSKPPATHTAVEDTDGAETGADGDEDSSDTQSAPPDDGGDDQPYSVPIESKADPSDTDGARADADGETPEAKPPAEPVALDDAHRAKARELADAGVKFLLRQRGADGGWSIGGQERCAATALVLKCLLQHPDYDASDPVVRKGFDVLLSYQQDDGGIYEPKEGHANYSTSVAVMALATADEPRHKEALGRAVRFLRGLVITEGGKDPEGRTIDADHPMRGGVSYGHHGRPDLSNVGMWMEAMHQAGVEGGDPDMQKVLSFVARTQNLTEKNQSPWALAGPNDGGFIYAPAVRKDLSMGESKAGSVPGSRRGLRSYGSMTYTGFKSLLYANVGRDDPRVQAAFQWIRKYWRLDANPNMPHKRSQQGLYYYYHVFAKALRAWGRPTIRDTDGQEHNWRHELIDALGRRVSQDGSWKNAADRWFESNRALTTCYAVLALQEALK